MRPLPTPSPPGARCPGCDRGGLIDVFDSPGQPVFVGLLPAAPEEARRAPRGDIVLAWCGGCGLVHNRAFEAGRVAFGPGYEVSLAHSPTFNAYIQGVAARLVHRYALIGRTVLEIGSGDGYFLRLLASLGIARGIGVDPTTREEGEEAIGGGVLIWRRAYFDPDGGPGHHADFVCALSVLEAVPDPAAFLGRLRRRLAPARTPIYVDVFNGMAALARGETWSIHYEQCHYFGGASLIGLFERAGFDVVDAGPCYEGDQYLFVEARPASTAEPMTRPSGRPAALPPPLAVLAARHREHVDAWNQRLAALDGRAVLWGSGGKGVSFLNTVPSAASMPCVVDINPARQQRFVPGTGTPIVAPEALLDVAPDVIVATNALYEGEIRARVASLGLECEVVAAEGAA